MTGIKSKTLEVKWRIKFEENTEKRGILLEDFEKASSTKEAMIEGCETIHRGNSTGPHQQQQVPTTDTQRERYCCIMAGKINNYTQTKLHNFIHTS